MKRVRRKEGRERWGEVDGKGKRWLEGGGRDKGDSREEEGKKVIGGRKEEERWLKGGGRDKGDWREEEGQRWLEGGRKEKDAWREEGRRRMIGERKNEEGWLEGGRKKKGDWREEGGTKVIEGRRKDKGDWREEGRRRMIGERKNEEGWLEGERKVGKKEETKEWSKKRDSNLVLQGFLLYGARLSNAIKYDSLPHMSGRKNIHLLTTYLWFFASVHFPLFFFRSEPIDK